MGRYKIVIEQFGNSDIWLSTLYVRKLFFWWVPIFKHTSKTRIDETIRQWQEKFNILDNKIIVKSRSDFW